MSGDSGYESERNFGDSTLSLGNAIAASTATTPLTTSAGLRHHTMLRHRKYANVQSERIATISACKHHTVDSDLCQRRVFQTASTTYAPSFSGMEDHIVSAHFIPLIVKLCRKEFVLSDPRHKDMVAFPEIETQYFFVGDPFQSAFRRIDQLTVEFIGREDENIPIIAFELWKHKQAT